MALLERVAALVRANLNDLVDKAEDPEKMLKQVILDMQNQLLQVKTQVAIAVADQHLLARKARENEESHVEWMRKAELAVGKKDDGLARGALDRAMSYEDLAKAFHEQIADQRAEVESLKAAFSRLEQKLVEARSKADVLTARHRRARAGRRAGEARLQVKTGDSPGAFGRMESRVRDEEALDAVYAEITADGIDDRFAAIEKEGKIEELLKELKARKLLEA